MSIVPALAAANMGRVLTNTANSYNEWETWISKSIRYKNSQSFNTGSKTAVVRSILRHDHLGLCFTIVGDDVLIPCVSVFKEQS